MGYTPIDDLTAKEVTKQIMVCHKESCQPNYDLPAKQATNQLTAFTNKGGYQLTDGLR